MFIPDDYNREEDEHMVQHLRENFGGHWRLRDAMYDSRCYGCRGFIDKGDWYYWGGPNRSHHRALTDCED